MTGGPRVAVGACDSKLATTISTDCTLDSREALPSRRWAARPHPSRIGFTRLGLKRIEIGNSDFIAATHAWMIAVDGG